MIKKKFRATIFGRSVLIYIAIYMVPMLILSVLIYQYAFYAYENYVEQSNQDAIETFTERMDENLLAMFTIYNDVELRQYISADSDATTQTYILGTVELLNKYIMAQNDILEIGLWSDELDYYICGSASYQMKYFEEQVLHGIDLEEQIALMSSDEIVVRQIENGEQLDRLLFIFPLPNMASKTKQSLFFVLDAGELLTDVVSDTESLEQVIIWKDGTASNGYQDRNIFFGSGNITQDSEYIDTMDYETDAQILKVNGTDMLGFYNQSNLITFQYRYLFMFDKEILYAQVYEIQNVIAFWMLLCFAIGMLLVYVLIRYNYAPMKRIYQFCLGLNMADEKAQSSYTNGVQVIEKTLFTMHEQIEEVKPMIQTQVMLDMLNATPKSNKSIYTMAFQQEIVKANGAFAILILDTDHYKSELESYLEAYSMEESNHTEVMVIHDRLHRQLILISSMKCDYEKDMTKLEELLLSISQEQGTTIGRSAIHMKEEEISNCYLEAVTALSFKFIKGRKRIIVFDKIKDEVTSHSTELDVIAQKLIYVLNRDDIAGMQKYPEEFINVMQNCVISLYQAKRVANEIIDAIIKYSLENEIAYQNYVSIDYDFTKISNYETLEEIIEAIRSILYIAINKLEAKNSSKEKQKVEEIRAYIQEKACDAEFSVEMVADIFDISYAHIGKYFKSYYNITVVHFVNQCRMEKAKSLLEKTDLAIQDIATNVGYYNVTSFNRMFKKSVGMTPMEFRKYTRTK